MTSLRSMAHRCRRHWKRASVAVVAAGAAVWLLWPPAPPFPPAYSRAVYDAHGRLLRVTLAADGQFRFPPSGDSLPVKYVRAVTCCEDRRFFLHPGIDPLALAKSVLVNIRAGRRVRGGSTITMQVARLSRPAARTYFNKCVECALSLRLSLHLSKRRLLALYAGHAPMGGNTVGVEAASWRYFGKPLTEITWAEAALFTVLPNAPSMLNLEKQRPLLKAKRDRALGTLRARGIIDSLTCALARKEPLPPAGGGMPFEAPHLSNRALAASTAMTVRTTLDLPLQHRVEEVVQLYSRQYAAHGIPNIAVLVARTQSAAVAAYVGSQGFSDSARQGQVDGVAALRSTGSLLKPFLVVKALDRGPYVMESMLQDVPTFYGSFCPQNASREFAGLVSMRQMLIQSLNVPAVRLLYWYGVPDFYSDLRSAGLSGLFRSPEGYGLSLILGGAEASLWDLTGLFAALGSLGSLRPLRILADTSGGSQAGRLCSEGAAWLALNTLHELNRPGSEYYWQFFTGQVPVAWKTGTSYGQKDAWAIGTNLQWTIGVWVGSFAGEGNAALGGAQSAGPVLFQLFNALSDKSRPLWFAKPQHDLRRVQVCPRSGLPLCPACTDTLGAEQPACAYQSATCPYHERLLTDRKRGYVVCSRCWNGADTAWRSKTIVPPAVRSVLARHGYATDTLPAHNPHCPAGHPRAGIDIVYPVDNVSIIVPRNLLGMYEKVVFRAEYQRSGGHLFWYLDGTLLAETVGRHTVPVDLPAGKHRLVVLDSEGSSQVVRFAAFRAGGPAHSSR